MDLGDTSESPRKIKTTNCKKAIKMDSPLPKICHFIGQRVDNFFNLTQKI